MNEDQFAHAESPEVAASIAEPVESLGICQYITPVQKPNS